ncbi:DUF1439 domain-containing protein [Colwellia hornerae]|uniref:DUF1439 domain-containing protein n=1 Tax=Colwellia hornerae TaxID=89402 RepID=A0A5C6Q376_9GAMM|nr:DUF1439 domain-containing protein [Colwellia hornerae]TWX47194.1 DUF1439 domain-containing protein [Colwellia hornerae]TWX54496.1 DUF1439 domain-containing protein [Colwellia hornerae]TWX63276.1 DUF1439 domain-containing protein [Colwellia hornerae]
MFRIIIIIILSLLSQIAVAFDYTQEITEQEIQEKVSALMPIEKKKYFVTVKISNPIIALLKATDEIGIRANIDASAPGGIKGSGEVMIKGTLDYDPEKGEFYFKNPTIIKLAIDKIPKSFTPKIQDIAQAALSKMMAVYPVYKFKDDNLKHKLAKAVLKSLAVKDEKLIITLGVF